MWGVEIEKKIQEILINHDPKYHRELSGGFFYNSTPLYIHKVHMREALVFLLDRKVPPSARILDFACGTGQMLLFLWHFGFRNLIGWDANPLWLSGARALFGALADVNSVALRAVDRECIYDIKAADQTPFDVITMLGLIYGMGIDPARAIGSAAAALKPGGCFICNDHVHEPQAILAAIGEAGLEVHRHIVAYADPGVGNNVYLCRKRPGRAAEPEITLGC